MISANLRTLRKYSRYTLEEVAEIIGVSRQAVAKWEGNETYPDLENCVKLSALYKVSLDALIKEPIQLLEDASPNDKGQYMFGIVKVSDTGEIPIPDKAKEIMEFFPGDRLLILGDKRQGIAIMKCDGLNDYLDVEE